jgi:hypothetical protein
MRAAYGGRLAQLLEEEEAKGISASQIAREISVKQRAFHYWKDEGRLPQDLTEFLLLCRRLHTHPNYLLGWSDDRYPHDASQACMSALDEQLAKLRRGQRAR